MKTCLCSCECFFFSNRKQTGCWFVVFRSQNFAATKGEAIDPRALQSKWPDHSECVSHPEPPFFLHIVKNTYNPTFYMAKNTNKKQLFFSSEPGSQTNSLFFSLPRGGVITQVTKKAKNPKNPQENPVKTHKNTMKTPRKPSKIHKNHEPRPEDFKIRSCDEGADGASDW